MTRRKNMDVEKNPPPYFGGYEESRLSTTCLNFNTAGVPNHFPSGLFRKEPFVLRASICSR